MWKSQWRKLYDEGSLSWNIIDEVCNTFYLVNLVDNDFVNGNAIYDVLSKVLKYQDEIRSGSVEAPQSPMDVDQVAELNGACGENIN